MTLLAGVLKPALVRRSFRFPIPTHLNRWVSTTPAHPPKTKQLRTPCPARLLRSLDFHLKNGDSDHASNLFWKAIKSTQFEDTTRYKLYDQALTLFLRHRYFRGVSEVYGRMVNDGYLPSLPLRAAMSVLTAVSKSPSEETLVDVVSRIFDSGKGNETALLSVLRTVSYAIRCRSELMDSLVEAFLRTRDPDFVLSDKTKGYLVRFHRRAGSFQHAQRWLASMSNSVPMNPSYNASSDTWEPPIDIPNRLDVDTLNSLLATQFAYRRTDVAFNMYSTWRNSYPEIIPNTFTFMMLFRALSKIPTYRPRSIHNRRFKPTVVTPAIRKVFCHMIQCHTGSPGSSIISPAVLALALRTFMSHRDYAGAFVCLRSFIIHKCYIHLSLYRDILGPIVSQIQVEHPWFHQLPEPGRFWSYTFLGHPSLPFDFDIHLFEGILRLGERRELALTPVQPTLAYGVQHSVVENTGDHEAPESSALTHTDVTTDTPAFPILFSEPKKRALSIPSALEVLGMVEPSQEVWDVIPLERILKRAILASIPDLGNRTVREVSRSIVEAKLQMLPPKLTKVGKRGKA